jgi:hypothetical protein
MVKPAQGYGHRIENPAKKALARLILPIDFLLVLRGTSFKIFVEMIMRDFAYTFEF